MSQNGQVNYCADISINNNDPAPPIGEPGIVFDQFGNYYYETELNAIANRPDVDDCGCNEFLEEGIDTRYFYLIFRDCRDNTGKGFADPVLGQARRKAMCKVYAELANLIIPSLNPCDGSTPEVNIAIGNLSGYELPSYALGGASAYFYAPVLQGLNSGLPYQIINGGIRPTGGIDAYMLFNFTNYSFYADFDDPDGIIGTGMYDLYSIGLHEALHTLGFLSLMDGNGSSYLSGAVGGYSHYDNYLRLSTGSSLIVNSPINSPFWIKNPTISNANRYRSCLDIYGINGPDLYFGASPSTNYPVYTGPNHQAGSSFSHLYTGCDGTSTGNFVMHPFIGKEMIRNQLTAAEISILSTIGYRLDESACVRVAGHDEGPACSHSDFATVSFCPGAPSLNTTLIIAEGDLLGNDVGLDNLVYFEPLSPAGNGSIVDNNNDTYTFTPDHIGPHILRYVGESSSHCGIPNVGAVVITAVVAEGCDSFCDLPPEDCTRREELGFDNCYTLHDCDRLQYDCNLICNPSFCLTWFSDDPDVAFNRASGCQFPVCYDNSILDVPGWTKVAGNVNVSAQITTATNSGALRFSNEILNGAINHLQVEKGRDYFFSIYQSNDDRNLPLSFATVEVSAALLDYSLLQFNSTSSGSIIYPGTLVNLLTTTSTQSAPFGQTTPFKRYAKCTNVSASLPDDYNALLIYANKKPLSNYGGREVWLDDFELLEDRFTAGNDISIPCGTTATLGGTDFCMLSNIVVGYRWLGPNAEVLLQYSVKHNINGLPEIKNAAGGLLSSIPILNVNPSIQTTYTLSRYIIDNGGAMDFQFCSTTDEVVVTVSGSSDACFAVAVCGQTVSIAPNQLNSSNIWEMGDGTTLSAPAAFQYTYSTSGTFSICRQMGTQCPSNCCLDVVIPQSINPDAKFSITQNGCEFTFRSLYNFPGQTHHWNFGDGTTGTGPTIYHFFPSTGIFTIVHRVQNACGFAEETKTLTVNCTSNFSCPCLESNTLNIDATTEHRYSILEATHGYDKNDDGVLDASDHNGCIAIIGKLIIDENLKITGATKVRMQPCSEIVVSEGSNGAFSTLELMRNNFSGCIRMWKGITVNPHCTLVATRNSFADAEFAIHAIGSGSGSFPPPGSTTAKIGSNDFQRNHVGVLFDGPSNGLWPSIAHAPFAGNTFDGAGTLLPPCSASLVNYASTSGYVGVATLGVALELAPNTFRNLRNGTIGENTWMDVAGCTFKNIIGNGNITGLLPPALLPSYASSSGVGVLHRTGLANITDCTFDGVDLAVYGNQNLIGVKSNEMPDVTDGVISVDAWGIGVENNLDISYRETGIEVVRPMSNEIGGTLIAGNILTTLTPAFSGVAVYFGDNTQAQGEARVTSNIFNIQESSKAILLNSSDNWLLDYNYALASTLLENDPLVTYQLEDVANSQLYGNSAEVFSEFGPLGTGYYTGMSPNNTFCCNYSLGFDNGMQFIGACEGTALRHQDMWNHNTSIFCSQATVLGDQPDLNANPSGNHSNQFY